MRLHAVSARFAGKRLDYFLARMQGDAFFWGITLLMMLDDDAAMLAMMFS